MAYCRFGGGSDVYLYASMTLDFNAPGGTREIYVCCCCYGLAPPDGEDKDVILDTRTEALRHLEEHKANGQQVPESAIERLATEIAEEIVDQVRGRTAAPKPKEVGPDD